MLELAAATLVGYWTRRFLPIFGWGEDMNAFGKGMVFIEFDKFDRDFFIGKGIGYDDFFSMYLGQSRPFWAQFIDGNLVALIFLESRCLFHVGIISVWVVGG